MKMFLQSPSDGIVINHHITVTVESIDGDEVRLSIDAPPWVSIEGAKPADEFAAANRQAAGSAHVSNSSALAAARS